MSDEERAFERGDVVELRGVVVGVGPEGDGRGGQVKVDLGRGVGQVWVPVRRVELVVDATGEAAPGRSLP